MRILQVVYTPRLSGAEVLAKGVAVQHREGGHEVCIASMEPQLDDFEHSRRELEAANVLCCFPDTPQGRIRRLAHLWRVVRQFRPDIIIAHATIAALYVRLLPNVAPVIYVMHSGSNDFADPKLRWAERVLSRRAAAVVGVSPRNAQDYLREFGPHPLVTVIPNGVDLPRYQHAAPPDIDAADPTRLIVQLGRYIADKGQLDTIRAFEIVLQSEPDARLLLHGAIEDLAYHDTAMNLVHRLNLDERVTLLGPTSNVAEILQTSHVFAMPSHVEAHSIGFLEALASGIPVVASHIEAFEFARELPAVSLVDTKDPAAFARALVDALHAPRAWRALDGYTLRDSAEGYLKVAQAISGAGINAGGSSISSWKHNQSM
ncbi:glycosyltransferase family 4 protein [Paraburkholderia bengalensis]|uniref:Glycosyltransferase family 4 protein n=1 Tax=Paraburkholderia bengalensis TaxID=2747562 RepID=A0ABU8IMD3_9BURK